MASVRLEHVYKRYPGAEKASVADFHLEVQDKELLVLVGPPGCGKSTTLRMIAGLEDITEGDLYIGERRVNDEAPKDRDIARVFPSYALYPHMNVYQNMAFGLKLRKFKKEEIDKRIREAANILEIEHLLDRKPKALSGGQRQRVALGRAIVRRPQLYLMDEPLFNLDVKLRVRMRAEISELHKRLGATIVYATHDRIEAMALGSRVVVMKDGIIHQAASPSEVYSLPANLFVAGFIGSPPMNFIRGSLSEDDGKVRFKTRRADMTLPEERAKLLRDRGYIGREVVLGIRPEDIRLEADVIAFASKNSAEAKVETFESSGEESLLYLAGLGEERMIVRLDDRLAVKEGETIRVAFDMNRAHMFDPETEKNVFLG